MIQPDEFVRPDAVAIPDYYWRETLLKFMARSVPGFTTTRSGVLTSISERPRPHCLLL